MACASSKEEACPLGCCVLRRERPTGSKVFLFINCLILLALVSLVAPHERSGCTARSGKGANSV